MSVVAGIDLAAGRGISELAVLEVSADAMPVFDDSRHAAVETDDDIVTVLAGEHPVVVAIDAPLSLPAPVAAAVRGEHVAAGSASPYTRAAERDPVWRALGVRPLPVSFLGGLTFRGLTLASAIREVLPAVLVIETFPTGVARCLGIEAFQRDGRRVAKTAPGPRQTLQSGLRAWVNGLPEPRESLLGADLLDAVAAALAAVAYHRDAYRTAGNADEGQLVLPDPARFRVLNSVAAVHVPE